MIGSGEGKTGRGQPGRRSDPFYVWMAATLLLLNVIGFAPTFFFRSLLGGSPLPLQTQIHGWLFTSWFVLALVQSTLIYRGAVQWHRRIGVAGAGLAVAMVVSGLTILYVTVGRLLDRGLGISRASQFLLGNLTLLTGFATFVSLAIIFRHRPATHKRLMLLASLAMIGQSLARIAVFPAVQVGGSSELSEVEIGIGGLGVLLAVMVVHDKAVLRRVHPAVAWGTSLLWLGIVLGGVILPNTSIGQSLAQTLYG